MPETPGAQWQQLKPLTRPYDVVFCFVGLVAGSVQLELAIPSGKPAGVAYLADFSGSAGYCKTNPTATATFTILRGTGGGSPSSIGSVSISTSGVFTFSTSGSPGILASVTPGSAPDVLVAAFQSSPDASLADVTFTLSLFQ
jgi:hypothetical protein